MAETQVYSIAELSRCKLLHEASVKDRDLRRLVGHVNMYDRLLDALNEEETRQRDQSPPKSIKSDSRPACRSSRSMDKETSKSAEQVVDLVAAEKELAAFGYTLNHGNVSLESHGGYGTVSVEEVEISDDDD
jgi:hypothetical protein